MDRTGTAFLGDTSKSPAAPSGSGSSTAVTPDPGIAEPAAAPAQPGAATRSGAVPTKPGTALVKREASATKPAAAPTKPVLAKPAAVPTKPAAVLAQRIVVPAQRIAVPVKPIAVPARPIAVPARPGVVPAEPAAAGATPKATPAGTSAGAAKPDPATAGATITQPVTSPRIATTSPAVAPSRPAAVPAAPDVAAAEPATAWRPPPRTAKRTGARHRAQPASRAERGVDGGRRMLSRGPGLLAFLVVVALVVGGITVAVVRGSGHHARFLTGAGAEAGTGTGAVAGAGAAPVDPAAGVEPATPTPLGAHDVSGPVNGLRTATFELASGTAAITLRTAPIGNDLYRVSASAAAKQQPRVTVNDGTVQLSLTRLAKNGQGEVTVVLNSALRWSLRVSASLTTGVFDLHNSQLAAARFAGDAARIELRTPRLDGALPVRITGGINQFRVETTGTAAARVRIRGGAGAVHLNGRTINGIAPGRFFTARGFSTADDRLDVDAVHGIGGVTVTPA